MSWEKSWCTGGENIEVSHIMLEDGSTPGTIFNREQVLSYYSPVPKGTKYVPSYVPEKYQERTNYILIGIMFVSNLCYVQTKPWRSDYLLKQIKIVRSGWETKKNSSLPVEEDTEREEGQFPQAWAQTGKNHSCKNQVTQSLNVSLSSWPSFKRSQFLTMLCHSDLFLN